MSSRIYVSEPKLVRVVWNTNDWKSPSGPAGKSTSLNTHEGLYGYGYEEWVLDIDKQLDDYHYGFLQPFNQYFHKYTGVTFADIILYAIKYPTPTSPESGRYWVARLRDVEVLKQDDCKAAKEEYDRLDWTKQMLEDLKKSTGQLGFSGHDNGRLRWSNLSAQ